MAESIIKIENLSKQYRLGTVGTKTLQGDIKRWWAKINGKEDPFSKIGESNSFHKLSNSEYLWALRDINLEIKQGEVLGIIGKNGAGKSTLLKIISRITTPTTGSITINGRIASLLEVGTGFHPELSGRENIFINGAILGMTKAEIKGKLDEIIDFSGVELYIDTPVKRYSSGMYVRLAFAVAAHLEPEILVVDEVLAVGDAEFQKKALGKMQDLSKGQGRTVLFVSHNMAAVENLCKSGVLLENGKISKIGDVKEVVAKYLIHNTLEIIDNNWENTNNIPGNKFISLLRAKVKIENSKIIQVDTAYTIAIDFVNNLSEPISVNLICRLFSEEVVFEFPLPYQKFKLGRNTIEYHLPAYFLNSNIYTFQINYSTIGPKIYFYKEKILIFEIHNKSLLEGFHQKTAGIIIPHIEHKIF